MNDRVFEHFFLIRFSKGLNAHTLRILKYNIHFVN